MCNRVLWIVGLLLIASVSVAQAQGVVETSGSYTEGAPVRGHRYDTSGNLKISGPSFKASGDKTADTLVKTGAGMVHTLTCASDAVATAGTLAIRDAVSAGTGTIMQQIEFVAAYLAPVTLTLDQEFATGLYLDNTTTADVHCSVSYR